MESSSVRRGSTPQPRCGRAAELPGLHMHPPSAAHTCSILATSSSTPQPRGVPKLKRLQKRDVFTRPTDGQTGSHCIRWCCEPPMPGLLGFEK